MLFVYSLWPVAADCQSKNVCKKAQLVVCDLTTGQMPLHPVAGITEHLKPAAAKLAHA